jgi:iron complex outermembrane receptor protein
MTIKRLLRQYSLLLLCVIFTQLAFSQAKTISGKVSDDKGNPIQGATITVKGSKVGTSTDASGTFKLNVSASATSLVISSVGFTQQEIPIGDKEIFDVSLVTSTSSLNDVVVIGYGTARRKDLTGSVSQVTSKDFTTGNLASPLQAIQGKVPGLAITVSGGDPNGVPIVKLRGQASLSGGTTPLFVVDNVPLDDPSEMANIPAADIVTYDVLKDASATAIYGSRGSNGVILITTRRGHSGEPELSYNGSISFDQISRKLPLANTSEANQAYGLIGVTPPSSTYNTDWQDAMTRTGVSTNHSVSLLGGGRGFSYRGTVFYQNLQGVVVNTGKNASGVNFVLQQKALQDKLDVQANVTYTVTNRQLANYNTFYSMIASPTYTPVMLPNGGGYSADNALYASVNPVWAQKEETSTGREALSIVSGSIDYNLLKPLKIGVWGSLYNFTNQVGFYQPVFETASYNTATAAAGTENRWSYKGNAHIYYNKSWDKHTLSVSGVYEYNDYFYNNNAAVGQGYINDNNTFNYLQGGLQKYDLIYSDKEENKLISFLGRVAYNYDSRYYITASFRRDGSSKFGVDNQWGNFPSASVAWRITNENFMKSVSWANELKLSAGFGVVGNQDVIGNYQSRLLYSSTGNYYNNGSYLPSYGPTQNANPNLQWEQVQGSNVALDYTLFNHRLSGIIDYFSNKTSKLLNNYTVPFPAPGFVVNTILANVGTLTNKGFEFSLNFDVIKEKDFTWTIGGNISTVKTRITSLSGSYSNGVKTYNVSTDNVYQGLAAGQGLSNAYLTYYKVGYVPDVFEIPHFTGLNKQGIQTFDSAGVGTTTNVLNATLHYYDPAPKFNYAITNSFTYKSWGLSFFLRGVAGQKIFDNTRMIMSRLNYVNGANILKEALTDKDFTPGPQVSDRFLEKAGYLRLENLTIYHNFHVGSIKNLRVYIATNNLFVITHYVGFDPELRNAQTSTPFLQNYVTNVGAINVNNQKLIATAPQANNAYIDAVYSGTGDGYYPKSRSFTLGVNLTLK